ncbi:MAG: HNH endonuclease signature motif containing protein [Corynebacterium sp.]|nr:HNH endonuclease signature motif containing protein [Corynebacterium sp.]
MARSEKASYRTHDRGNVMGAHAVAVNKAMLQLVLGVTTKHDLGTEDLHSLALHLAAQSGGLYSAYHMEYMVGLCVRLHRHLGLFKTHALRIGVVSAKHLVAMERVLQQVDQPDDGALWAKLDAALVQKFTPSVPHQQVPTPGEVKTWLQEQLRSLLVQQAPADDDDHAGEIVCSPSVHAGKTLLTAELSDIDAAAVHECLQRYAAAQQITVTKALVQLVCQQPDGVDAVRKVVLFGIGEQKPDTKIEATWLHGVGPLSPSQRKLLEAAKLEYRDALAVAKECYANHDPSVELRMLVILRDRTCRFPGCTHPAKDCDIDHVINFEAGGWTTLSNLQCLCRRHHNAKTDRRVRATMTIDGAVTWHRADGTLIATTLPAGPLAGINGIVGGITTRHSGKTSADDNTNPPINNGLGRWGYTLAQKQQRIRKRIEQTAEPPDEPPPTWPPHAVPARPQG